MKFFETTVTKIQQLFYVNRRFISCHYLNANFYRLIINLFCSGNLTEHNSFCKYHVQGQTSALRVKYIFIFSIVFFSLGETHVLQASDGKFEMLLIIGISTLGGNSSLQKGDNSCSLMPPPNWSKRLGFFLLEYKPAQLKNYPCVTSRSWEMGLVDTYMSSSRPRLALRGKLPLTILSLIKLALFTQRPVCWALNTLYTQMISKVFSQIRGFPCMTQNFIRWRGSSSGDLE